MTNERLTGAALVAAVRAECDRLEALEKKATKTPWRVGSKNIWNDELLRCVVKAERGRYHAGRYRIQRGDSVKTEDADCALIVAARNTFHAGLAAVRALCNEYWHGRGFEETVDALNDWLDATRKERV